jgi:putative transcriptional regulator
MRVWLGVLVAWLGCAPAGGAQSQRVESIAAGKFLVASRDLGDPNFAKTVVLLLGHDDKGSLGLVINRRSRTPLSTLLKEIPEAQNRSDPVFLGGPVEKPSAMALLRARVAPPESRTVVAGVHRLLTRAALQKVFMEKVEESALRIYLGYAGWGPGQLAREVESGAWFLFPADAGAVFDADPDGVWARLIRRTERIVALNLSAQHVLGRR